ncbi:lipocalin family protein [Puniceibacterium confluentis]|uniref:lipocalin family protein n=1 Tax=Puniceibacterium confluentis TaxID=1958944 RepID=UPI0011B7316C|nr:lipocalin family protein [Puniceibacterium confluentis]
MRALALVLLLSACAAAPVAPPSVVSLRDPASQVASQADVTSDRLGGDWVVVQGAGLPAGATVRIGPDRMQIGHGGQSRDSAFLPRGAGRYATDEGALWVHWLDVGNRTAAIGDPMGQRVWIMDRTAASSPDRIRAAREILEWYGYDLARLVGR